MPKCRRAGPIPSRIMGAGNVRLGELRSVLSLVLRTVLSWSTTWAGCRPKHLSVLYQLILTYLTHYLFSSVMKAARNANVV